MDPDTFREVLSNLIANAVKYNRPEGKVGITAREKDDWVVVGVEDTGPGMDEKEIPFIFEQFYRSKAKEVRVSGTKPCTHCATLPFFRQTNVADLRGGR